MAIERLCEYCGKPFTFNRGQRFCSVQCRKEQGKQEHPRQYRKQEIIERVPSKKRKVAMKIFGIEVPEWAFKRYTWLQWIIKELKSQEEKLGFNPVS
jgi:uncharacterized Zn finger protein (UPF0148 family)